MSVTGLALWPSKPVSERKRLFIPILVSSSAFGDAGQRKKAEKVTGWATAAASQGCMETWCDFLEKEP